MITASRLSLDQQKVTQQQSPQQPLQVMVNHFKLNGQDTRQAIDIQLPLPPRILKVRSQQSKQHHSLPNPGPAMYIVHLARYLPLVLPVRRRTCNRQAKGPSCRMASELIVQVVQQVALLLAKCRLPQRMAATTLYLTLG